MNEERLRNVIKALRESPSPRDFTMSCWGKDCGTPMCAIGHYAFRKDLQDTYVLRVGEIYKIVETYKEYVISHHMDIFMELAKHFDLNQQESMALFGSNGCNEAKTIEEAIAYIEGFITEKLGVKKAVEELIESETVLK